MNHTNNQKTVIPAQAGIQLIDSLRIKRRFCSLRGVLVLLGSRLRGNDEQ